MGSMSEWNERTKGEEEARRIRIKHSYTSQAEWKVEDQSNGSVRSGEMTSR